MEPECSWSKLMCFIWDQKGLYQLVSLENLTQNIKWGSGLGFSTVKDSSPSGKELNPLLLAAENIKAVVPFLSAGLNDPVLFDKANHGGGNTEGKDRGGNVAV